MHRNLLDSEQPIAATFIGGSDVRVLMGNDEAAADPSVAPEAWRG